MKKLPRPARRLSLTLATLSLFVATLGGCATAPPAPGSGGPAGVAATPRAPGASRGAPAALGSADAALAGRIATSVDAVLDAPPLHRAAWGVLLQDAATGEVLYSRNAERLHIPASNMKLVVATVALGRLGPDWRYRTPVSATPVTMGRAATVVVRGAGDPTWSTRFYDSAGAPFDSMAQIVAAAGIRSIGSLVVDVSRFSDEPVHPTWEVSDLPGIYAPPVDAFAAGEGTFRLALAGGIAPGSSGTAVVAGPLAQPFRASVVTDTAGARTATSVDFLARRDSIVVTATVAAGTVDTVSLAVARPAEAAVAALLQALDRRGVAVDSWQLVRDSAEVARLPADAGEIGALESVPMSDIVAGILRPSQNWIAEMVLKTLGAEFQGEGSWRAGNQVARRYLVDVVGIDSTAFLLRDASGMSAQNLLAPVAAVAMLAHAQTRHWSADFRQAMAQPGVSGTTLSGRLRSLEGRVFAKTGTITNVNSLSGYLTAADGREYLFSVLSNASGAPAALVRAAIDDAVSAMATHLDAR